MFSSHDESTESEREGSWTESNKENINFSYTHYGSDDSDYEMKEKKNMDDDGIHCNGEDVIMDIKLGMFDLKGEIPDDATAAKNGMTLVDLNPEERWNIPKETPLIQEMNDDDDDI